MNKRFHFLIFLLVYLAVLVFGFGIHVQLTDKFNNQNTVITEYDANQDYSFYFEPQNGKEVSWTRTANINDNTIDMYACSYEGVFTNLSEIEVSDWTLRVDVKNDCFLNSAWCGVVEIHQNVATNEKVQTLDLRQLDEANIDLEYYQDGDINLFPLSAGDYLIYYPDEGANEKSFAATAYKPGQAMIGIIFYWDSNKEFSTPSFMVEYQRHRSYFQGKQSIFFIIAGAFWLLCFVAGGASNITVFVLHKKEEIENSKKEIEKQTMEEMLDEMIKALASSIDAKDGYTHGHSERVAQYALMLAQKLDLSPKECKEIFYAGLVHDVGKIAIPDIIINKPGRLTDEEFDVIKSHPARGEKILSKIEKMPYLAVGAKYHHERYDGKGYPCHVKGDEFPLAARIISVADAYDAMTSQRSYRKTLDQKIVKQEIWKGMGTQFDPLVAKHMIAMIDADVDYKMRQTMDETYEMINEISSATFWDAFDPKSIKSEETIMSDTSIKYFGEFVQTIDQWCKPAQLTEIGYEEREVKALSKTFEEAEFVWHAPTFILYTSDDGTPQGDNYTELAVVMSAGYSWRTGPALSEENSFVRKDAFIDWNNWISKNKEGIEYCVSVKRDKESVYIQIDNELISMVDQVSLPKDYNVPLYLGITGEQCRITFETSV